MASLLDTIATFLSPQEAEAKVLPQDAPSQRLVDAAQQAQGTNAQLAQIIALIVNQAHARPESINVQSAPLTGAYGKYDERGVTINNRLPGQGEQPQQATLAHELLHFLTRANLADLNKGPGLYGMDFITSSDYGHQLINYILGGAGGGSTPADLEAVTPFNEKYLTNLLPYQQEVFHTMLGRIFGGTPYLEQAQAPVTPTPPAGLLESIGRFFHTNTGYKDRK